MMQPKRIDGHTRSTAFSACRGRAIFHRAATLLPLLLASACTTTAVDNTNTLTSLEQIDISVQDEKVEDSLHKAMESYRAYIKQAPASSIKPEAIHRLADLEIEKSYRIEGVEAPSEPGAKAAIRHYTRLLAAYPNYVHSDRVLYQLSRAYEEAGDNRKAVKTLETLAVRYPEFERMDEVRFRLGEHYFRDRKYQSAIKAYDAVLSRGKDNVFYESALKKQGWTYFKQDDYSKALYYFVTALDYIIEKNYAPGSTEKRVDTEQTEDVYRSISLTFAYLGGPAAIESYINKTGNDVYEQAFYRHLAEYYLSKDRFTDAAKTYQAYIKQHPFSEVSASYSIGIIEIYQKGGFYDLAADARKDFTVEFGPDSAYWKQLSTDGQQQTAELQKQNIRALASYYHARYQKLKGGEAKKENYNQAVRWYREYYYLFPLDDYAPQMRKLLAELYLENKDYQSAAREFEYIAKNYPDSAIAAESAYAALFTYREALKKLPEPRQRGARENIAQKSVKFANNFPDHAETSAVLTAAAYDYLQLKFYADAAETAQRLIASYPNSDHSQLRSAKIVLADAAFESGQYAGAEQTYSEILANTKADDKNRKALTENLAASIYKQAENARKRDDHNAAAQHFLRLKAVTPNASLTATAQYEAASELVSIGEWKRAAVVLEDFQKQNPRHELTEATTRNLAAIYQKSDQLLKSAANLELVAKANKKDEQKRRDAMLKAAELYQQAERPDQALRVYGEYTTRFPAPAQDAIEAYQLIAEIHLAARDMVNYHKTLTTIIAVDAKAGNERTDRTRYLAAQALLVLSERDVDHFMAVKLTRPFKKNLDRKKKRMAVALDSLTRLLEYQVSDTTTAATFYIAEIYLHFSQALAESERPTGLNSLELEEYELALEEQAYVFEEKAISVFEKNTELLHSGIHDPWVDKSIAQLSSLFPAQYAKQEQKSGFLRDLYAADDRS